VFPQLRPNPGNGKREKSQGGAKQAECQATFSSGTTLEISELYAGIRLPSTKAEDEHGSQKCWIPIRLQQDKYTDPSIRNA